MKIDYCYPEKSSISWPKTTNFYPTGMFLVDKKTILILILRFPLILYSFSFFLFTYLDVGQNFCRNTCPHGINVFLKEMNHLAQ